MMILFDALCFAIVIGIYIPIVVYINPLFHAGFLGGCLVFIIEFLPCFAFLCFLVEVAKTVYLQIVARRLGKILNNVDLFSTMYSAVVKSWYMGKPQDTDQYYDIWKEVQRCLQKEGRRYYRLKKLVSRPWNAWHFEPKSYEMVYACEETLAPWFKVGTKKGAKK